MLGMSWSRREGMGSGNEAGVAEDSEPEAGRRVWQWWGEPGGHLPHLPALFRRRRGRVPHPLKRLQEKQCSQVSI